MTAANVGKMLTELGIVQNAWIPLRDVKTLMTTFDGVIWPEPGYKRFYFDSSEEMLYQRNGYVVPNGDMLVPEYKWKMDAAAKQIRFKIEDPDAGAPKIGATLIAVKHKTFETQAWRNTVSSIAVDGDTAVVTLGLADMPANNNFDLFYLNSTTDTPKKMLSLPARFFYYPHAFVTLESGLSDVKHGIYHSTLTYDHIGGIILSSFDPDWERVGAGAYQAG